MTRKIVPEGVSTKKLDLGSGRYGWGPITPDFLQCLHNPKFLVSCMAFGLVAQRIAFSLFPAIVTTISQRFQLSTTQIGFIASFNDVIGVLIAIFVAHYGEKGHKGRWIAISFILALAAIIIYVIPQWISEPEDDFSGNTISFNSSNPDRFLCKATDIPEKCSKSDRESSWLSAPFWLFTVAAVLAAMAGSPLGILGTPYIDESVLQSSSPVYLAIMFGAGMIAAALGVTISGGVLRVYGDFYRVKPGQIIPPVNDPSFYGAWWLGYVIAMPLIALPIIPMFGFARELPQTAKYRAQDVEQTHGGDKHVFGGNWSDYPRALKILAKNPVFMLQLIRVAVQLFYISGVFLFLPLFFEQVLGFPRSISGMLAGILLLVPALIGTVISSFIMKKLKMTSKTMLIFALILSIIGFFPGFGFLAGCPTPKVAGVTRSYDGELLSLNGPYNTTSPCNIPCNCKLSEYRPVCYEEQDLAFYNPCFAGCRDKNETGEKTVFKDCACLAQHFGPDAVVQNGICPLSKDCSKRKGIVLILIVVAFLIGGMEAQPLIQLGFRTIPFSQRTMASGIKSVVAKLFGFAPGPVVFGHYLDKACLQHVVKCGKRGKCAKYDHDAVSQSLTLVTVVTAAIVLMSNLISLLLYEPPNDHSWAKKMWIKISQKPVERPNSVTISDEHEM